MERYTEDRLNALLGATAEELDALGEAYEADSVEFTEADEVREGSPFDYIGTKRETFVIDAADFRGVRLAAEMRGCTKSDIYRDAVHSYLASLNLA